MSMALVKKSYGRDNGAMGVFASFYRALQVKAKYKSLAAYCLTGRLFERMQSDRQFRGR